MRFNVPYHCRAGRLIFTAGLVIAAGWVRAAPPLPADDKSEPAKTEAAPPEPVSNVVENSVVKVFSTVRYPDFYKPWTKQAPGELTASGVVIEGKRILSNAHAVLYASQVQVQANQAGDKVSATVVAIAPGIDLAVLKLDDETFFDTHPPLPRARMLPEIKDAVMAYGYPKGGTSLSITKGIVSRIEFASYNLGTAGLRIQIDAAINPGNSGGPAVVGDKMIGLAFSHLASSESIGYIIPCEEIDLFLEDIADGHYDGKPAFVDDLQTLENPALRAFLKLDKADQGMVVHRPDSDEPTYPLKQWDVISKIGDTPVDDEGMIKLTGNLRVFFSYMVQKIAAHGKVPLTVIRADKELRVEVPVQARHPAVITSLEGAYPSYFVYGPLVFSTATLEFVGGFSAANRQWLTGAGSALITRLGDKPAFPGEGLVVVSSPFFPHKLSKGYSSPLGQVVKTVNGQPIKNLKHLVEVLRDSKDEFIRFEFDQRNAETLVFPREQMVSATDDILGDNGLRSQGSPDTMAVWTQAKTSK
jgi:S1-C subfamily serine protease